MSHFASNYITNDAIYTWINVTNPLAFKINYRLYKTARFGLDYWTGLFHGMSSWCHTPIDHNTSMLPYCEGYHLYQVEDQYSRYVYVPCIHHHLTLHHLATFIYSHPLCRLKFLVAIRCLHNRYTNASHCHHQMVCSLSTKSDVTIFQVWCLFKKGIMHITVFPTCSLSWIYSLLIVTTCQRPKLTET